MAKKFLRFVIEGEIAVDPIEYSAQKMDLDFNDDGEVRIGTLGFEQHLQGELARALFQGLDDATSLIEPLSCSTEIRTPNGEVYPAITLNEMPVRRPDGSFSDGWFPEPDDING